MSPFEMSATAGRAARALGQSLTERLGVDDVLDAEEVYRCARTLAALIQPVVDDHQQNDALATTLDEVLTVLAIRLGESVDARLDDDIYQLGRAMDVLTATRRRYRRRATA